MTILSCCECGVQFNCRPSRIKEGKGKFCSRDCRTANSGGLTLKYPKEYGVYSTAVARCKGTHKAKKARYCDRGIEFRFASFADFMAEMGPRPDGMQLDRIDNDGHYEAGNVKWTTPLDNSRNRECSVWYELDGVSRHLIEWAESLGVTPEAITRRIQQGWSLRDALTIPKYGRP